MISGTLNRYPGIYLTAEENLGKPQLGELLMEAVQIVIASNGILYFQMLSLGLHSNSAREKEEKREGLGKERS